MLDIHDSIILSFIRSNAVSYTVSYTVVIRLDAVSYTVVIPLDAVSYTVSYSVSCAEVQSVFALHKDIHLPVIPALEGSCSKKKLLKELEKTRLRGTYFN
jgi:hypothetical protein